MKRLVILGAGTAGTMILNKLDRILDKKEWEITIIDKDKIHYYQPGFLFIPFGIYQPDEVMRQKADFFPPSIQSIFEEVDTIDPVANKIKLMGGDVISYDYLIIATGCTIRPEETEGLKGAEWRKSIFDFYTFEGAKALAKHLRNWKGGKLVLNITEMPIKCPVAPLEFVFLADDYFQKRKIRDKVDITLVTPLSAAFTKPKAAAVLGNLLERKNINIITEFNTGRIDNENKKLMSFDDREVPFDLLVTIPTNVGSDLMERSNMGDELNFVPTDKHTLQSKDYKNIFVMGDATTLPTSKAGSVAHFQADVLVDNFLCAIEDRDFTEKFDGHANCFIESGHGKGFLIDFNYEVEPLPGKFPLPGIGPFSLLKETKMNHYGKVMFRWAYWNLLLKGADMPIESGMSMVGKNV